VVSGGELYRAVKGGADPKKIVFSGVGKREDEIEYALKTGILMSTWSLPRSFRGSMRWQAELAKKRRSPSASTLILIQDTPLYLNRVEAE